ncbi:outer membrane protein assembly factor BamE [Thiobacillus sp.]|uniref:outer membrane protein assembly factor BamE n=1 Tax=Thiobacillus sp. TaxID=924 RepID=UPI0018450AD8|nr:outer membrane protein assembly factor BamE [Thiobacillus sp.]MBC2730950.1 outer membrane protein assembly factor BamE [Thiobacillus sp.]MBC2739687.1 outer membrane protein assembly factor BamE [Thiobacillus sp.]MBC2758682.1 outer membrane protein assembly factor BamE [Thiobacillus sp.]
MRQFLISALLLSLLAGCSSLHIGPHHIDVQQGNALDQENVARLKTGLNRSQVRFLLGTPLVVDPFRTDRWDYVYLYYKAGKLTEQKHITLIFEGDTLARIEGDLPEPAAQPAPPAVESERQPASMPAAMAAPAAVTSAEEPAARPAAVAAQPAQAPTAPAWVAAAPVAAPAAQATRAEPEPSASETSIVPPLPSPKDAPAYVDPRPVPELSLKSETDVSQIKPDAVPPFPEPHAAAASDDPVLKSVHAWADAWMQRDSAAYFAAYDASFVPEGSSRAAWEARKRKMLSGTGSIEVRIDSPSVERTGEGAATVNFKQYYRAGTYHDTTVKQLRMIERDGRWVIVEEKVLSTLKGGQR